LEEPSTSLTVSDDNTVSDAQTGLLWQRCPLGQIGGGCAGGVALRATKTEAEQYCTKLGTGWRLPTISELLTIADYSISSPAINETLFPLTPSAGFWSETPAAGSPAEGAWYVDFKIGSANPAAVSANYAVRCVRSGS